MTLYAKRKLWDLEPYYSQHVSAMTSEALHAKSDIAAELAFRDASIAEAYASLARANKIIGEAADEAKRLQDEIDLLRTKPAEGRR